MKEIPERKKFSGMANLPEGHASANLTEGCICLEGGAFRGCYTSGVLDALMENDINFQTTIGVSAGAMNGYNYVSGQIGRSARINLAYRHDSRFVGLEAIAHNFGVIGFDFLFGEYNDWDPFDEESFQNPERRYVTVATDVQNGKTAYMEKGKVDMKKAIQASASMPYVSRPVEIGGNYYLDGGCSCSIPIAWPLKHNFEKIVVVRTRALDFRLPPHTPREVRFVQSFYHRAPHLAEGLETRIDRYNTLCEQMAELEKAGRIFVIAPKEELGVGILEGDMEKLGSVYYDGYNDTLERLDELKAYLEK